MTASPKYRYSKVDPTQGSHGKVPERLLRRWEMLCKEFGFSRQRSHCLLLVLVLVLFIGFYVTLGWLFGSSEVAAVSKDAAAPPNLDIVPGAGNSESGDELRNKSSMTVISSRMGSDGRMHTETTTETTGLDRDGHTHATRETKSGEGANREAEQMMSQMNSLIGGFGFGGGLLDRMFGQQDPFAQLRRPSAHEVLRLRDQPQQHAHEHEHQHHHAEPHYQGGLDLGDVLYSLFNPRPRVEVIEVSEIPLMLVGEPMFDYRPTQASGLLPAPELEVIPNEE